MANQEQERYPFAHPNVKIRHDMAENPRYQEVARRASQGEVLTIDEIRDTFKLRGDTVATRIIDYVTSGRFNKVLNVPLDMEVYATPDGQQTSIVFYDWRLRNDEALLKQKMLAKQKPIRRGVAPQYADSLIQQINIRRG